VAQRKIEAARARIDAAPREARLADGGRVDERQHLFHVIDQHAVEERRVLVLQRGEKLVALERGGPRAQVLEHPRGLLLDRLDARRQQPLDSQPRALLLGEGGALVAQRIVQREHSSST
jgi:hypothetical protein